MLAKWFIAVNTRQLPTGHLLEDEENRLRILIRFCEENVHDLDVHISLENLSNISFEKIKKEVRWFEKCVVMMMKASNTS